MVKDIKTVGSRAEVMHGKAKKTSYGKKGLTADKLRYNKRGKIVSILMSDRAKKDNRLSKAGFETKEGVFGAFKNGKSVLKKRSKRRRKSRRKRN